MRNNGQRPREKWRKFSLNFSRDQNRKSPSTVFFNSETKRKRLRRRLICSEDDLRSRILRSFVVEFLACLPACPRIFEHVKDGIIAHF